MVSVPISSPDFESSRNPGRYSFQGARWRSVCLVLLLIFGQALLLHHVVQHGQEHAIGQDEDEGGCSFCAVGGHMVANALSFQPVPSSVLVWVVCLLPVAQFIISPCPQAFGARGPPLPSVV
jgi:hypothetical protein